MIELHLYVGRSRLDVLSETHHRSVQHLFTMDGHTLSSGFGGTHLHCKKEPLFKMGGLRQSEEKKEPPPRLLLFSLTGPQKITQSLPRERSGEKLRGDFAYRKQLY